MNSNILNMINNFSKKLSTLLLAACAATVVSAKAQILTDTFSYAGGGLNPATYVGQPNKYQPAVLIPDTTSNGGGGITYTGLDSGGLGSGTTPNGYGFFYTFFSESVSFSYDTSTILTGVESISISFASGGGVGAFVAGNMTLDYNASFQGVTTADFSKVDLGKVPTPSGLQSMTLYTWTWDVSALGATSGFGLNWSTTGPHSTFSDITVTQAVPEPSTYLLIGLGLVTLVLLRKRVSPRASV